MINLNEHLLAKAITLAVVSHKEQIDKSGLPYIMHPLRVMESVRALGIPHMIVAILHDIVEDTPVTIEEIENKFGEVIAEAVNAITHPKSEPSEEYLARVKANPLALTVKFKDIHDNMLPERLQLLPMKDRERMIRKYTKGLIYLAS